MKKCHLEKRDLEAKVSGLTKRNEELILQNEDLNGRLGTAEMRLKTVETERKVLMEQLDQLSAKHQLNLENMNRALIYIRKLDNQTKTLWKRNNSLEQEVVVQNLQTQQDLLGGTFAQDDKTSPAGGKSKKNRGSPNKDKAGTFKNLSPGEKNTGAGMTLSEAKQRLREIDASGPPRKPLKTDETIPVGFGSTSEFSDSKTPVSKSPMGETVQRPGLKRKPTFG